MNVDEVLLEVARLNREIINQLFAYKEANNNNDTIEVKRQILITIGELEKRIVALKTLIDS